MTADSTPLAIPNALPRRFGSSCAAMAARFAAGRGSRCRRCCCRASATSSSFYAPPLVVARLLGAFARGRDAHRRRQLAPYVLAFAGLWLAGEVHLARRRRADRPRRDPRHRGALHRGDGRAAGEGPAFFQDNFAGSLTKRALGYARRFEDVFDVAGVSGRRATLLPLVFVGVVLWRYSPLADRRAARDAARRRWPWCVPLIRRRQRARGRPRGGVERARRTRRRLDRERRNGARVRARARRGARSTRATSATYGAKTLRSWDYQNTARRHGHVADVRAHEHARADRRAGGRRAARGASLEAVFLTFSYFATATRVMWEFNRIYRNLEGALTDAAQFAELLLDPPAVVRRRSAAAVRARATSACELRDVSFRYSPGAAAAVRRLFARDRAGDEVGLVGRSGGGKTTLTRLLLRFADVEARRRSWSAASRSTSVPQAALRGRIGYVPQDPAMFHRTIADNIRVGRPGRDRRGGARARRALAHAAEFIEALPDGYADARRRARREAVRRPAPAHRDRARDPEGRADPDPRRGDELARLRERGAHPGRAVDADGEAHGDRHRAPPLHGAADGLARRPRPRPHRRAGLARGRCSRSGGIYASLWAHQSGGFLPATDVENVAVYEN